MKKILVAVDETEASERAAGFVDEFFPPDEYSISAVYVARRPVAWFPAESYGGVSPWPPPGEREAQALEEAFAREEAAGQAVASRQAPTGTEDVEVLFGKAVDAILLAADDVGADLIVVGSNDKGFLQRLFGSSVSEGVVRSASRPVLVVR
jgi:nucleotide-binding universal stress UspA family protein